MIEISKKAIILTAIITFAGAFTASPQIRQVILPSVTTTTGTGIENITTTGNITNPHNNSIVYINTTLTVSCTNLTFKAIYTVYIIPVKLNNSINVQNDMIQLNNIPFNWSEMSFTYIFKYTGIWEISLFLHTQQLAFVNVTVV